MGIYFRISEITIFLVKVLRDIVRILEKYLFQMFYPFLK